MPDSPYHLCSRHKAHKELPLVATRLGELVQDCPGMKTEFYLDKRKIFNTMKALPMSIKKAIIEKNEGNEVENSEYVNLILDDMNIGEICEEDRQFFLHDYSIIYYLIVFSLLIFAIQR